MNQFNRKAAIITAAIMLTFAGWLAAVAWAFEVENGAVGFVLLMAPAVAFAAAIIHQGVACSIEIESRNRRRR